MTTDKSEKYWAQTLLYLEKSMTEVVYNSIILPLYPISFENNTLTIMTDDDFFKTTISTRYLFEITRCARTAINPDVDVRVVSPEDFDATKKASSENYAKTNLLKKYTFDTFVKGKSNELAYAAAWAVADAPGQTDYNPLFLYGGVGLGKTHLMHSIGNHVIEEYPDLKVMYQSTETFTNELIYAIREKSTQSFKNKYRNCDLLLLDDIQFLERTVETQEEMFHTFNTLYNDSKQIVITSDQSPKELTTIEKRLTTRFGQGLTVDVTLPDYETRIAILDKKLALERLVIPDAVKEFIIRNVVSNIRDLEGALNKVTAYARLTNTPITLDLAKKALRDQVDGQNSLDISVPYIQQVVAEYYNLTVSDLTGRRRLQSIVFPRQIAMYLSRKILDASMPHIGKFFGGRDHTTVMYSCDKIASELESDSRLRADIMELERLIQE